MLILCIMLACLVPPRSHSLWERDTACCPIYSHRPAHLKRQWHPIVEPQSARIHSLYVHSCGSLSERLSGLQCVPYPLSETLDHPSKGPSTLQTCRTQTKRRSTIAPAVNRLPAQPRRVVASAKNTWKCATFRCKRKRERSDAVARQKKDDQRREDDEE